MAYRLDKILSVQICDHQLVCGRNSGRGDVLQVGAGQLTSAADAQVLPRFLPVTAMGHVPCTPLHLLHRFVCRIHSAIWSA
jgi:hypothetical protein